MAENTGSTPVPSAAPPRRLTLAEEIPGLYNAYVMDTYAPSLVLVRGKGALLWDSDGHKYLDFLSGIATTTLGHAHPAMIRAVRAQVARLMHVSNLHYNEPQGRLAKKIAEISLGGKVFFCNSGAEANEGLIKLARLWGSATRRHEVITFRNSFHGRTLATLTATGQEKVQAGFAPLPTGFRHAQFNDMDSVRQACTPATVAVLIEGIQGEGGVVPADPMFMRELRAFCDERNLLLLMDEIQTGIGRTGKWFSYQHYGITPDAFSIAKGLGGGFPIGAVVTSTAMSQVFRPGTHGTTYGGNPLACTAALAVLDTIEKKSLLAHTEEMGALLDRRVARLDGKYPFLKGIRGKGLLKALVLDRPGKELEKIMMRRGLLTVATGTEAIRLLPPLIVTASQVRKAVSIIDKSCREWQEMMKKEKPA